MRLYHAQILVQQFAPQVHPRSVQKRLFLEAGFRIQREGTEMIAVRFAVVPAAFGLSRNLFPVTTGFSLTFLSLLIIVSSCRGPILNIIQSTGCSSLPPTFVSQWSYKSFLYSLIP